jgi:hypothetical protein
MRRCLVSFIQTRGVAPDAQRSADGRRAAPVRPSTAKYAKYAKYADKCFDLYLSALHCSLSGFSQPAQVLSSSSSNSPFSITRTRTTTRTILVAALPRCVHPWFRTNKDGYGGRSPSKKIGRLEDRTGRLADSPENFTTSKGGFENCCLDYEPLGKGRRISRSEPSAKAPSAWWEAEFARKSVAPK